MFEDVSEDDKDIVDQNLSLNDANKKARDYVLKSSSDEVIPIISSANEDTPRKKLKTKKELNELRQRQQSHGDDEDTSEDGGDSGNNSSDLLINQKKSFKKLNQKALLVDLEENEQLKKTVRIDMRNLKSDIREDLNNFAEVCWPAQC